MLKEKFIKINNLSRPGYKIKKVKGIVIHYTANPGATAMNHYNYYNNTNKRYAGAHIFIDKNESLLLVPLNEITYHANESKCKITKLKESIVIGNKTYYWDANTNTIGIEICIEKDGSVHENTYKQTIDVVVKLLKDFNLTVNDIYRHHDITGKNCPAFFVGNKNNEDKYKKFLNDITINLKGSVKALDEVKTETVSNTKNIDTSSYIGNVEVLVSSLNVREKDDVKSKIVKTISKGSKFKCYKIGSWGYNLGGNQWVSKNEAYTKLVKIDNSVYHTIIKGDTLYSLSKKYNISINKIKELNNLKNDTLTVGLKLKIK